MNKQSADGDTPLFLAVKQNKRNVVALLLQSGADPNKPNREVSSDKMKKFGPLQIAIQNSK